MSGKHGKESTEIKESSSCKPLTCSGCDRACSSSHYHGSHGKEKAALRVRDQHKPLTLPDTSPEGLSQNCSPHLHPAQWAVTNASQWQRQGCCWTATRSPLSPWPLPLQQLSWLWPSGSPRGWAGAGQLCSRWCHLCCLILSSSQPPPHCRGKAVSQSHRGGELQPRLQAEHSHTGAVPLRLLMNVRVRQMPALLVLLSLGNAVGMLLAGKKLMFGNAELCTVTHSRDSMPASTGLEGGFLGESPYCKLSSKQALQIQTFWRGSRF